MQLRAADILDVSSQIVDALNGTAAETLVFSEPVILAADDLSPSETIGLDRDSILGFVTSSGSASSHTAILARTMGIPALVGVGAVLNPAYDGCQAILNGDSGELFLNADELTYQKAREILSAKKAQQNELNAFKGRESITKSGKKVSVFCNIGSPVDADTALDNDAEGIGLFRSEFLYLGCDDYPDEELQFDAYRRVLSRMNGKKVVIRTMDIGADKQIDYFNLEKEENPALGLRGVRLSLHRPEIFHTQLRALYRAPAWGNLAIMFPMINSLWELRACRKLCEEVQDELTAQGIVFNKNVEIGIMIETPAAVIISDELAQEADFFSVGTNDLTQYMLACDRQNSRLGSHSDPYHPAAIKAIEIAANSAHRHKKWIGICGELAADHKMTKTFLRMGIDELSVSPKEVLPLRKLICDMDA